MRRDYFAEEIEGSMTPQASTARKDYFAEEIEQRPKTHLERWYDVQRGIPEEMPRGDTLKSAERVETAPSPVGAIGRARMSFGDPAGNYGMLERKFGKGNVRMYAPNRFAVRKEPGGEFVPIEKQFEAQTWGERARDIPGDIADVAGTAPVAISAGIGAKLGGATLGPWGATRGATLGGMAGETLRKVGGTLMGTYSPPLRGGKLLPENIKERAEKELGHVFPEGKGFGGEVKDVAKTGAITGVIEAGTAGLAKLKPHGKKWVRKQSAQGQQAGKTINQKISTAYERIYGKAGKAKVDAKIVDDVIMNLDVDEKLLNEILNQIPEGGIQNVQQLKYFMDTIKAKVPKTAWDLGGTSGKGGLASKVVQRKTAYRDLKDVLDASIEAFDPVVGKELKALNQTVSKPGGAYEVRDAYYNVFGKQKTPITTGIPRVYKPGIAQTSKQDLIKRGQQVLKELSPFTGKRDKAAEMAVRRLIKGLERFTTREAIKGKAKTAAKVGAVLGLGSVGYKVARGMFSGD